MFSVALYLSPLSVFLLLWNGFPAGREPGLFFFSSSRETLCPINDGSVLI